MKRGGLLMYPVHAVPLIFSEWLRQNLGFNGHILVRLLPVSFQDGGRGIKNLRKCSVVRRELWFQDMSRL